jgi:hypothetical protein
MSASDDILARVDAAIGDADVIADRLTALRGRLAEVRGDWSAAFGPLIVPTPVPPPPVSPPVPVMPDPPPVAPPPVLPQPPPPIVNPAPPAAFSTRDANGWTLLPAAADARILYVSASEGKAANDGLSPQRPMNSISAAVKLLRDKSADRLLLRRGDRFDASHGTLGNLALSGRSAIEPIVIGAYGDGDRPCLAVSEPFLHCSFGPPRANLAIVGLHLTAAGRDPSVAGFNPAAAPSFQGLRIVRPIENLLIEDCRIELFDTNVSISQAKNVVIRRCIVTDAWATAAAFTGQGIYIEKADGVLIEECLFDHNGWSELVGTAMPSLYRHNLYLQSDNSNVILRGNIIARGASHGAWMRSGGSCQGNLFLDNALHVQIAGERGVVEGNLFLGGRDINPQTRRGHGVTLFSREAVARNNLFAGGPTLRTTPMPLGGYAIGTDLHAEFTPTGERRAQIAGNIVLGWIGPAIDAETPPDELIVSGNMLLQCPKEWPAVLLRKAAKRMTFSGNRYQFVQDRANGGFHVAGKDMGAAEWAAVSREAPAERGIVPRMPQAFAPAALRDLLQRGRDRRATTWNATDSAAAICQSLRQSL